jgi:LmbE family N-acetylglucosaminyl deacetylase
MFHLTHPQAEIFFPDPSQYAELSKTTHLGIGAHQDDLEMMAIHGILAAYDDPGAAFTGVTVTDGRGAPRNGAYVNFSDDALWAVRNEEQKAAAKIGNYLAQVLLNFPSEVVKSTERAAVVEELKLILQETLPQVIYTHNLADKHDTHVAVALAVLEACRDLPGWMPDVKVYGCELWRGLDWLPDDHKVALDVSAHPELQDALLAVFQSQIAGGKRYDLAAIGRRQANATFYQSHAVDKATRMVYAMDLTPLIWNREINISDFIAEMIQGLAQDVKNRYYRLDGE